MALSAYTADQIAAAKISSYDEFSAENLKQAQSLAASSNGITALPVDNYRTALDAEGKPVRFGYDADGNRIPSLNTSANPQERMVKGQKVVIAPGQPYLNAATGEPALAATGYMLECSSGATVRLFDSLLTKLDASTAEGDKQLMDALCGYDPETRKRKHAPFFTGKINAAVIKEQPEGARWPIARLIEA